MEDAPKTVTRSAVQFFFGTILSRFSGFFREVALGAWLGATPMLAAFFVAYRFSQLLRRLFGESALLASFSPHFEELRSHQSEKAGPFFRDLLASISTVLGTLILLLEAALFSWWKWGGASAETEEILFLTMVMLPGVLFICLYALFSALLQTDRRYFLPSAAPIFFNVVFLIVLWSVKNWEPAKATAALAGGVTVAFFIQWGAVALSTVPFLKQIRWHEVKLWAPDLKKMVSSMGLTIVGIGAVQVNGFIDTLFARSIDLIGPAYLYYAIRLYQLPLALFGIALSSALIPPLARARQAGETAHFLSLFLFAVRRSLCLMIPITAAFLVFGESIVNLVYGRGAFDILATLETTRCLWGYSVGLVPAVLVLLLAPAFYAQKDFKTPLKASLISVGVNLGLNFLFIEGFKWGPASVAMATSLAAIVNAVYLFSALDIGSILDRRTALLSLKVIFCTLFSALLTMMASYFLVGKEQLPRDLLAQVLHLVVHGGLFALLFFSYAWMMKLDEVFQMIGVKSNEISTSG